MVSHQEKQIIERFGRIANDPDILKSCTELLKVFDFDVEELYINWETFCYSKNKSAGEDEKTKLSVDTLSELQGYVLKNLEQKSKAHGNPQLTSTKKTRRITSSPMGSMFDMLPSTPMSASKRKLAGLGATERAKKTPRTSLLSSSPTKIGSDNDYTMEWDSPSAKIAPLNEHLSSVPGEKNSGEVLTTLNSQITNSTSAELREANKILLASNFDPAKYKFRIMRQNLLEAADVLDDQIDSFTNYLKDTILDFNEPGNPNIVSQADIIAVGRITPDSPLATYDETLNKESICLEPSRSAGIGQRVRLNLSKILDFAFFPGQIVALKGRNANGRHFTVSEVLPLPLLGSPTSTGEELQEYNRSLNGGNLKIVVTAGPYTTNDSLDFTQLSLLVDKMNNEVKPQYIVMFGPFLDYTHPKIVDGSVEEILDNSNITFKPKTLDDVFKALVAPILKKISPQTQVIIIPSTRDASSRHPSYPQDSFNRKQLGLDKNFKCFPNPSSFQLNECLFGASNNDIFKDLKDISHGEPALANRFDRIANYILEQRRYYPLFPGGVNHQKIKLITPPPESIDFKISEVEEKLSNNGPSFEIQQVSGSDLDVPYLGLTEFTDATPEVLIIPSQLKFFARVVKNVVVINPGHFMKAKRAGTYAVLNIEAPKTFGDDQNVTKVEGEDNLYVHDVWKRCRVDIVST